MENKVFGQGGKVGETDKLNIDSIIARLLEGKFNRDGFVICGKKLKPRLKLNTIQTPLPPVTNNKIRTPYRLGSFPKDHRIFI